MTSPGRDDATPKITYSPTLWKDSSVGGTPLTAARLNNTETGLVTTTTTINTHDDRLDALEAAAIAYAQGVASAATHGPTTSRPAPALGTYFYDETLRKPIWGDGAAWRDAAGTVLTGAGSAAGPTNFTAAVQADNSILCSWSSLSGAATYKVNDARLSPTGVPGATALTTTSFTYRPSTLGNYDLWVTAQVGGVETSASNHAAVTLSGGSGQTPAQILNIGTGSTQNHFNVGIGYASGHIDKTLAQITAGFIDSPYFVPNAVGNAVQFSCFANGGTTSSTTDHPRSELREEKADGSHAGWTCGSGRNHRMMGTSTITHLPADSEASGTPKPNICYAQIHDDKGDVVRMQVETDSGTVSSLIHRVYTHSPDGNGTEVKTPVTSLGKYTVGTPINWMIDVVGTTCSLYIGGTISGTPGAYTYTGGTMVKSFTISGTLFYFKAGDYQQFSTYVTNPHGNPDGGYQATSYARVELKNLYVNHTPAL